MLQHKCDYGCLAAENKNEKCVYCGHPRAHHSPAHPHICMGAARDAEGIHYIKPCEKVCGGFTLTHANPIQKPPANALDDFVPLEGLE